MVRHLLSGRKTSKYVYWVIKALFAVRHLLNDCNSFHSAPSIERLQPFSQCAIYWVTAALLTVCHLFSHRSTLHDHYILYCTPSTEQPQHTTVRLMTHHSAPHSTTFIDWHNHFHSTPSIEWPLHNILSTEGPQHTSQYVYWTTATLFSTPSIDNYSTSQYAIYWTTATLYNTPSIDIHSILYSTPSIEELQHFTVYHLLNDRNILNFTPSIEWPQRCTVCHLLRDRNTLHSMSIE